MITTSERELPLVPAQESEVDMALWAKPPQVSNGALDRAGKALATLWNDSDLDLIDSWRAAHGFPLNTFQTNLRYRAKKADPTAIVVQRLKRLATIQGKLERFSGMQLSSMQDIGGCRAILKDLAAVQAITESYRADGCKVRNDYINNPKEDGYRGVHIVGRYQTDKASHAAWNNYRIEIQLRTRLQHAFATAVEVVGTMSANPLKFGGGDARWRRLFSLAGCAFAIMEGTPLVPGTPQEPLEIATEMMQLGNDLKVDHYFPAWNAALTALPTRRIKGVKIFVLILNLEKCTIKFIGVGSPKEASAMVLEIEKDALKTKKKIDVLQAHAHSIHELKRAYPNYRMDTDAFYAAVDLFIAKQGATVS